MSNQSALEQSVKNEEDNVMKTSAEALAALPEADKPQENRSARLFEVVRQYASLSDLLRYGGALSVATAMALFLFDGARGLTDIERFLSMLGFTGALTVAGFLMSIFLKEQRGSRVFVGLSLLAVPVNFTVFGALMYSFIPLDGIAASYPGFAHWSIASVSDIALAGGAGLAVLMPVVWAGFTVLARPERKWLSTALLVSGAALLVPVRHEVIVSVVAVLAVLSSVWFLHSHGKDSLALKTMEGKFARALLFVSPLIIVARSVFLYEATGALLLILSGAIYMGARYLLASRSEANWFSALVTLGAVVVTYCVGVSVFEIAKDLIQEEFAMMISVCGFLALTRDLTVVSPNKGLSTTTGVFNVILATCLMVALALFAGGILLVMSCVAVLMAIAVAGYLAGYPLVSVIAAAGMAVTGVTYFENLWSMAVDTGWWGIAGLGVIAIVAGSLVDRAGTVVKGVEVKTADA